ncbi:MAG: hypothetical protein A3K19_33325 [Lentisphaerae bacterium RIFOXYB12_FULL_65_16]|nr:MAG: hypothetical protein A3K18_05810 [Lentisphaerae bacterium RIFOXYA12_64_32]OGV86914.1 MAG: hypothetical protein A3K19_33325 [Lentisphaerae bacterium RIFOXYB12_FULL_65_16]
MDIVYQPVSDAQIETVRALADRIWRISYPGMITLEQIDYMLGWMYSPETLREELSGAYRYELVVIDGQPSGFFSVCPKPDEGYLYLCKLYVLPELQGQGLGQQMLAHIAEIARASGLAEIRLNVNRRNTRALRAYEKFGFTVRESVTNDIGHGFVMDDYVMSCRVSGCGRAGAAADDLRLRTHAPARPLRGRQHLSS